MSAPMNEWWFYSDLPARQQQLCAEIDAQKKERTRKINNAACRKQYQKRKATPWHQLREAARLRRERWAAKQAMWAEKRRVKAERKRLREVARKRKFRDPIAEWNKAFQAGVEAGRLMERQEWEAKAHSTH